MSFNDTKTNLSALEDAGRSIHAEEMYNLLGIVLDDALGLSHAVDSSKLLCEDRAELVQAVNYILSDALKVYYANRQGIEELSAQTQQEVSATEAEAKIALTQLKNTSSLLKDAEEKRKKLLEEQAEAEAKNGHLLQIQTECDILDKRIAELNDSSLEGMEERLHQLQTKAAEREARAQQLEEETAQRKREADAQQVRLDAANQEKADTDKRLDVLQASLDRAKAVSTDARKREAQLKELLATVNERNSALLEYSAQYTETFNAINAVINDPFICKNAFSEGEEGANSSSSPLNMPGAGTKIETPADLRKWMDSVQHQIEQLLSIYQDELQRIAKLSESLTVPKD